MEREKLPDPLAWFEDLVTLYPEAATFRPKVEEVRKMVFDALEAAEEETKHARGFMQEKLRRYLIELVTTAFDKQTAYTTVILSVGYVGLFTAWAQSGSEISPALSRFVVVTGLLSLVVFIAFEVTKMVYGHVFTLKTLTVVQTQGDAFDSELHKYLSATDKSRTWFLWAWAIAVAITLLLGLMSAGALIYAHLEAAFLVPLAAS